MAMNRDDFVQRQRKRYLAQVLEHFEEHIEQPFLPASAAGAVQDFKGLVRARMNALAVDALEIMALEDRAMAVNGAAQELRESLSPTGRP
jgi:molybdopterin synthase catalytic subunit